MKLRFILGMVCTKKRSLPPIGKRALLLILYNVAFFCKGDFLLLFCVSVRGEKLKEKRA